MKKATAKKTVKVTSAVIQKHLDAKITPSLWDNETDRFFSMSKKQLTSRLFRITNPVKMESFRQCALQHGYENLAKLAAEKRDFFMEEVTIH